MYHPITFNDYILDPATDNPHLQLRKMPKGLRDAEKRQWLETESLNLKIASDDAEIEFKKTGNFFFRSLSDALKQEAKECKLASKRKYIDRTPC